MDEAVFKNFHYYNYSQYQENFCGEFIIILAFVKWMFNSFDQFLFENRFRQNRHVLQIDCGTKCPWYNALHFSLLQIPQIRELVSVRWEGAEY